VPHRDLDAGDQSHEQRDAPEIDEAGPAPQVLVRHGVAASGGSGGAPDGGPTDLLDAHARQYLRATAVVSARGLQSSDLQGGELLMSLGPQAECDKLVVQLAGQRTQQRTRAR